MSKRLFLIVLSVIFSLNLYSQCAGFSVAVGPTNPVICAGQNSITLTAATVGGTAPYSYLWNNVNPGMTQVVGQGIYTVTVTDASGCTATSAATTVIKFMGNPHAIAGPNQTVCNQSPATYIATLNGSVSNALGGLWSGGNGIFSPNNSTLSGGTYTPTAAEVAAGFVILTLTTTGNGTCPPASNTVRINYVGFIGTVVLNSAPISCFGSSNGTATVTINGGSYYPYTYAWNTVPAQTSSSATNLSLGAHTVLITNSLGCTTSTTATITQPAALSISIPSPVVNVTCPGGTNGSITVGAVGGGGPYTYEWLPGHQTSATISGQAAGTYSLTVQDAKFCYVTGTYTITQPSPIVVTLTPANVSCFGGTDGAITSSVTGGGTSYIYNWSSGPTSPNAAGLSIGTYILNVTDNNNCPGSASASITQPAVITAGTAVTIQTCNGLNNGTAGAVTSGGTPPYSYLWQPGGFNTVSISGLAVGTYTLTTTDSKGCFKTSSAVIASPAILAVGFTGLVNVSCFGGNNGSVKANPSGGTTPYTYLWSPGGATSQTINSLTAGTYNVTVHDGHGCIVTNSVTINQPVAALSVSPVITNVFCNGGSTGAIALTPNGGTSPYTYAWLPGGQTSASITNLAALGYSVTLKDFNGCTLPRAYTVTQPPPPATVVTVTNVSCILGNNGTASASVTGGNGPYTYSWAPGGSVAAGISNLTAGTYTLSVTDANGCVSTKTAVVTQPAAIVSNPTVTNVVCSGGSTGAITLAPTGGTGPYTYLWSQGNQTSSSITGLPLGVYSVIVKDFNGCQITSSFTITQLTLTIAVTPVNVACFGGNTGSASGVPAGGTPNYTYSWSPGGATSNSISNLTAGPYTLTVHDNLGCIASKTVTITQPPTPILANTTVTNPTCSGGNNGSILSAVSGGIPGYTYLWQPGGQTSASIINLAALTYTLTIKDLNGCKAIVNPIVAAPLAIVTTPTAVMVKGCYCRNNGSISLLVSGGSPGYTYKWMPGSETSSSVTNLTSGFYRVTVTDSHGCVKKDSSGVLQPPPLVAATAKTDIVCSYSSNGTASVFPSGGTPPYTYKWMPGGSTSSSISNLTAGTYIVTITDADTCHADSTAIIKAPLPLAISFVKTNVSCYGGNNGSITATASGGNIPTNYIYLWTPGGATSAAITNLTVGTYKLKITDKNSCVFIDSAIIIQPPVLTVSTTKTDVTCYHFNNGTGAALPSGGTSPYTYLWTGGQTSASVSGLSPGSYNVTVKDAKLCTATGIVLITEPSQLGVNFVGQVNVTGAGCSSGNNGSVGTAATGGTPGYIYSWSPGGATSAAISNLTPGIYTLTLHDNSGCVITKPDTIKQPSLLAAAVIVTPKTCSYLNDGKLTAAVSGGIPPYTYNWLPGPLTGITITNLASGTYSLTITDATGCTATASGIISATVPSALTVNILSQTNVNCFGSNTGAVSINTLTLGGTPNYTYSWAPPAFTTSARAGLTAGLYTVTVTDGNSCIATKNITITQPAAMLSLTTTQTNVSCNNGSIGNNGTITALPSGGAGGYTYNFTPPLSYVASATKASLAAGTYTVSVKDVNGCTAVAPTVTITQPSAPLTVGFSGQVNVKCKTAATGSVTASPAGGTAPYTYSWATGGGTSAARTNLAAGIYSVTVTDANSCVKSGTVTITEPAAVLASNVTAVNETCNGGSNGKAISIPTGGTGTYTYLWAGGAVTSTRINLPAGSYPVTVTDANLCTAAGNAVITEPGPLGINFTPKTNADCFGGNDGAVSAFLTGGDIVNYTYLWQPGGVTLNSLHNLTAGTYTLTITQQNGCSKKDSVVISQPAILSVAPVSTPALCNGSATGALTSAPSGGTPPYNYLWITPAPIMLTTQNLSNLFAGTYSLTVTDSKQCTVITTVAVTQPVPIVITTAVTNSGCGLPTGSASVASLSGGVAPFTYFWSPGGITSMAYNNIVANHYTVLVTDHNGCSALKSAIVNDAAAPVLSISSYTNVDCNNNATGAATVNAVGGVGVYSYVWAPYGGTNASATGLISGSYPTYDTTYTVTVTTSPNGCKASAVVHISQPPPILAIVDSISNVTCIGGSNGAARASAFGGTPGFIYHWLPGSATGSSIAGLSAATDTIKVTDAHGCIKKTSFTITQPLTGISVSTTVALVSCFGLSDGALNSTDASGENGAPFTYSWMPGSLVGKSQSGLPAASYTLTITDAKGCSVTNAPSVIPQPGVLSVSFSPQKNVTCFGGSDGADTASVSGGTPGYLYSWVPAEPPTAGCDSLNAGTHTLTVTDLNGCKAISSVIITEPAKVTTGLTKTDETCNYLNNGTASSSPAGGTAGYVYLWQPGALTSAAIAGLSSGNYALTVADSKGCLSNVDTVKISEPSPLGISFSGQTNVSCFGGNNGALTGLGSGGTPGYSYYWLASLPLTSSISGLIAGTYTLTLTDVNSCVLKDSITVTQPAAPLSISLSFSPVLCNGGATGSVSSLASGGTGPYDYKWMPGNFNAQNLSNLAAGKYIVTATDFNGCSVKDSITVTQPNSLALATSSTNSNCSLANGKALVSVLGGVKPFSYQWQPYGGVYDSALALLSGTYTVIVTDSNACTASKTVIVNDNASPSAVVSSISYVTCNGGSDGTAAVTVFGGTGPFTYYWLPSGRTDAAITGLFPGFDTVIVTDVHMCSSLPAISAEIIEPPPISITVTSNMVSCFGGNDGGASAAVSGGTPGYTYQWLPGIITGLTISGLSASTDTLKVTDAHSCVKKDTFLISQPSAPLSAVLSNTSVSCYGGSNGSVSAIAAGGTSPYNYSWMPGNGNGSTDYGLSIGTFTLTLTDSKGCSLIDSASVAQPSKVILAVDSIDSKCSFSNGKASVFASGGKPSYTYQWMPYGGVNDTASALMAGLYTVRVTDSNGCIAAKSVTVNNRASPAAVVYSASNVTCNGFSNGVARSAVTGVAPPYKYLWQPSGGTDSTASGLAPGSYTLTVTDSNLCQSQPAVSPQITEPYPILVFTATTTVSCFGGSNGSATVTAAGGMPGYTYLWSDGSTGLTLSNLSANTYNVQVKDTQNAGAPTCASTASFDITEPSAPLSAVESAIPVSCFGGADGKVSSAPSGGTPPYNFSWMPGGFIGPNIASLSIGTYTVTIVDSRGCSFIDSAVVTQPSALVLVPTSINSNCSFANGKASVIVSGGIPPYTYLWSPAGGTDSAASSLLAGPYGVAVNDSNACPASAMVTVNDNPGPTAVISTVTNVTCYGVSDGTATVTPAGAAVPFTYIWTSGGTNVIETGLNPGIDTVIVIDANLCQSLPVVSPLITQPFPLVINVTTKDVSCFGMSDGTASAIIAGGTPGYSYQWSASGAVTSGVNGLSANTYTLQVRDTNSCLQTASFIISQPAVLTSLMSSTYANVKCFGGSDGQALVSVSGGTPVYNYNWSPSGGNGPIGTGLLAGNDTVTITDFNGCVTSSFVTIIEPSLPVTATASVSKLNCFGDADGSIGISISGGTPGYSFQWTPVVSASDTAFGLPAGNYSILVSDTNNCQANIFVTIVQPPALTGNLVSVNPSCSLSNGSVNSQISGGTPPYAYLWLPSTSSYSGINSLGSGLYTFKVTDSLNCSITLSSNLIGVSGPSAAISSSQNVSCFGGIDGSATVNITNGTAPFSISWLPYGGSNLTASALTAGTFTVNVTDAAGCAAAPDSTVLNEPVQIGVTVLSVTNVLCHGGNNGAAAVAVTGGTGNVYTYSWSPVNSSLSSDANLTAGTYTVNVTDQKNCVQSISVNVFEPPLLISSIDTIINPTCFNGRGSASILSSGGTPPYRYQWTPWVDGQGGNTASNIGIGTYTLSITDTNGCNALRNVLITQPLQVITSAGPNDTLCLGQSGSVSASASGGAGQYYFTWQPSGAVNSGTLNINPVATTIYSVIAFDQLGCIGTTDTTEAVIFSLQAANVHVLATTPICPGQNSSISVQTAGTTGPLTYQWNYNLGSGPGVYVTTPSQPTTYIVTVSTMCGISVTDSVRVLFNPQPVVTITHDTNVLCVPAAMQFYDNSVSGNPNDPINSWIWNFGDGNSSSVQNPDHTYNLPGTYLVTLTANTGGGCTSTNSLSPTTINAYPRPVAAFSLNSTSLALPYDIMVCTNQSVGAVTYKWDFGDGGTSGLYNPHYLYSSLGSFQVQLIADSQFGCKDTAATGVITYADVVFPTAFTPNMNGSQGGSYDINGLSNDVFFPYTAGVVEYQLEIFNRWGELIFESQDIKKGWDGYYKGQLCQEDVYIWKADIVLGNGKTFNKSGTITLLQN